VSESSERVECNLAELEALLARVREALGEQAYQKLQAVVATLASPASPDGLQGPLTAAEPKTRSERRRSSRLKAIVSQSRAAQAYAQRAERLFRETFERAAVGIAHVAADGRFLRINKRFCQMVGYSADEMLARTFQDITHPDDMEEDLEFVRRMLSGELQTYSMDKRYLRKDGRVTWVNLTVVLVRDDSGEPDYFISVVVDINERKEVQATLELRTWELNERVKELGCLYSISEASTQEGLELVEKLQRIADLLPGGFQYPEVAEASISLGEGEFSSKGFHPSPWTLSTAIRDGRKKIGEICVIYREERPSAQHGPFLQEERKLLREVARQIAILIRRMHSERELREAKERAEEISRLKSLFLANVGHELRTPMNSILGYTSLVLDGIEGPILPAQEESLRRVERNAEQLLHLINQLLDFSRIEAGKVTLAREPFSLRETVRQTVKTLDLMARRKELQLSYSVQHEVPDILIGDASRLEEILMNLGENAIKFTEQGSVSLLAEMQGRPSVPLCLHFAVTDTGIGIPPVRQQTIFDAFEQAPPYDGGKSEGLGLGLAICSDLVALLGGQIWVESEVDTGSTFHFTAQFGVQEAAQLQQD
jgi:PAS domain S-box-containing protein